MSADPRPSYPVPRGTGRRCGPADCLADLQPLDALARHRRAARPFSSAAAVANTVTASPRGAARRRSPPTSSLLDLAGACGYEAHVPAFFVGCGRLACV